MALTSSIVKYDSSWMKKFEDEQVDLVTAIGAEIQSIYHVGSTSIPGLVAKPEIDILIVLNPVFNFDNCSEKLVSLGYDFRGEEPGQPGHWYFIKNIDNVRTHKLHLCIEEHPCIEEQVLFRNYLRENPSVAQEYGRLKLLLESENKSGIIEYLNGKAPFIAATLLLAKLKK